VVRSASTGQDQELERLHAELAKAQTELLEARERAARAEERIAGRDALLEELRRQNDWLRRPWWRKLLG
jgi:hypothetical protein